MIRALLLTLVCLLFFPSFSNALENSKAIKVSIIDPLKANDSEDAYSRFSELKSRAKDFHAADIILSGAVASKELADKSYRIAIQWHSLSIKYDGDIFTERLNAPLISQFTSTTPLILRKTEFLAMGDLEELARALLALNEQITLTASEKADTTPKGADNGD